MARLLDNRLIAPRFTLEDAQLANETWGFNCGPAAVATMARMTLDELRPHLGEFEQKRYTNPTLMWQILNSIAIKYRLGGGPRWPEYGLARVQWEGPWTAPNVPIRVRYRHTHWVGSMSVEGEEQNIFDVNCLCVGGWVPLSEWSGSVVPWILRECEPKASGVWHLTHTVELIPPGHNQPFANGESGAGSCKAE